MIRDADTEVGDSECESEPEHDQREYAEQLLHHGAMTEIVIVSDRRRHRLV